MAANSDKPGHREGKSAALKLAEDIKRRPLAAAAIAGGAAAAVAGTVLGARALARRNGAREGKPVNQVLAAAITATEAKAACQVTPDPTTKPEPGAGEAEGHPS
jgi:H+/Cl- antiporter ClcA